MSRSFSLAVLLMIGGALAAEPALAQGVVLGATVGPLAPTVSRAGPYTWPGEPLPDPMPEFDPAVLGRDILDLDPEQVIAGLASVTHYADGRTEVTPASPELIAIYEAELAKRRGGA